jgi:hypothetical protein
MARQWRIEYPEFGGQYIYFISALLSIRVFAALKLHRILVPTEDLRFNL